MGRPHTALVDLDRIADTALLLLDKHGEFTMQEIAKRLKVNPSALYHHVKGREGVIELLRQRLVNTVEASVFEREPWDQALLSWARSYRATFAAHAGAIQLMAKEPLREPVMHAMYNQVAEGLLGAGFRPDETLAIITATESFILGSALDAAAPSVMFDDVRADINPYLAEIVASAPDTGRRADEAFDLGLQTLIQGYRSRLAQHTEIDRHKPIRDGCIYPENNS
jgi:AcrR family transcriptional regulator